LRLRRLANSLALAIALLTLSRPDAFSSTALLHGARGSAPLPAAVTTFGGAAEFTAVHVTPVAPLTVVWLIDTFDAAKLDRARTDLASLFREIHGRPLRLVVLRGKDAEASGPFLSGTRLERAIADIELTDASTAPGTTPSTPAPGPGILDAISDNADQFGSRWSPVLLVGDLPKVDEAVSGYAQALLARSFTAQELRVFLLPMTDEANSWSPLFESTGGGVVQDVDKLNPLLQEPGQVFVEVTWKAAQPSSGFVVFPAVISDADAQPIATLLDLGDTGTGLPTVAAYASQQEELKQTSEALRHSDSGDTLEGVQAHLVSAEKINPADPLLLNLKAVYCERTGQFSEAVKSASLLTEVRPASGSSFAVLGHAQLLATAYDKAEAALNKAAQLKVAPELLAEDYARVYLGRSDEHGALPYLDVALRADGKRQELWFLRARAANHVQEFALAIRSYEQGLNLGGVHVAELEALLRLYLSTNEPAKAHEFSLHTIEAMPANGAPRAEFAQALEDVKLPGEALTAWKSVLAVQPDMELAHLHIAQLLLNSGNTQGSEEAAAEGLRILPKSADLYLVQAEAILRQGRAYDARSTLQEGAAAAGGASVLSRLATVQDAYGSGAGEGLA
jgi:tetratricopeptide (TPR) repeat protein